jgi:hypothetical protein
MREKMTFWKANILLKTKMVMADIMQLIIGLAYSKLNG